MATQPMMQPMAGDPDAMTEGPNEPGMTEFCIGKASDGSLSVWMEQGADETAEANAQPANDIGAALKMVLDLYNGTDQQDASAQFDEGFGQEPGSARVQRGFK